MKSRIYKRIEELGEVVGGGTPSTNNEAYWNGDIPWISPKDLTSYNYRYISRGERNITKLGFENSSAKMLPKGSILFSSRAPIGYVAIATNSVCTNQGFKSVVPSKNVDPLFLYYLLKANGKHIANMGSGTTFKEVSGKVMRNIVLPIPSTIEEQKRISSILDSIDSKIELNNKINDYLFECCMAKMNNVVGVSNCTMTVGDCCESIYSGGTPSTKNPAYWNGNLPWLSSGETRARFIIDTEKTITELGAAESSTKQAKAGDVVMASAGQGFTRGQTSMLFFDTYVNQSVVVMRPKRDYGAYLLLMLAAQYEELRAWSDSTSTRGSMSGKLLRQFELPYFGAEQAKELMDFATPIFAMIENNMRESKAITRTRDALLPKLMSGEIDVSKIKLSS